MCLILRVAAVVHVTTGKAWFKAAGFLFPSLEGSMEEILRKQNSPTELIRHVELTEQSQMAASQPSRGKRPHHQQDR
ncbi:uncharacterized [Tachysurus ichikawai]